MSDLTNYRVTDGIDDVLAAQYNRVLDSTIRAEMSNIQTLSANRTLTNADYAFQVYAPTAARDVILPAVSSSNHPFYIVNTSASYELTVKNAGGSTIGTVAVSSSGSFASDGASWHSFGGGVAPDITLALTHAASSKTPPVDADELPLLDSAASYGLKKLTWANIKAALDSVYLAYVAPSTSGNMLTSNGSAWESSTLSAAQLASAVAPGTSGNVLTSNGSAWTSAAATGGRTILSANRTYYVRTDGSDSNNGLTNTSGGAFLTIQKAVDVVCGTLDIGSYSVTIQIADGTYTGAVTLGALIIGSGIVYISGNATTPANVIISTTANSCFTHNGGPGVWQIQNMELRTTTSGECIWFSNGSTLKFTNIRFGACAGRHLRANANASITAVGNYSIVGGAVLHILNVNSYVFITGVTITFTTNPTAFSQAFILATGIGYAYLAVNTFTNKAYATGAYYNVYLNSVVDTSGGGATYLPGNSAGTTATGGQYA